MFAFDTKTDAEILAEEARVTDKDGTPRQKLARQAFVDIRKTIPMADQALFNEYITRLEFLPEGVDLSMRQMAEEMGINRETLRRHINAIDENITKTINLTCENLHVHLGCYRRCRFRLAHVSFLLLLSTSEPPLSQTGTHLSTG